MTLSFNTEMPDKHRDVTNRIPSAAERYYAQPRTGSFPSTPKKPGHSKSVSFTEWENARAGQTFSDEHDQDHVGKVEGTPTKISRPKRRPRSLSVPTRHSPRLIPQRIAALESILRERLSATWSQTKTKSRKTPRRRLVKSMSETLPRLSEDPLTYNFHLPVTLEDRIAIRAALTPTLYPLQKKGWHGEVVWNSDASYIEAHQKCMREYYKFERTKKPNMSPLDLSPVLILLPWYGSISDFRESPNWPEGW
jgi:hypothetical protein